MKSQARAPAVLSLLSLLAGPTAAQAPHLGPQPGPPTAAPAPRQPLALSDAPGLFRRVIVRPGSRLSTQPAAAAPSQPVAGFSAFYVYSERTEGQSTWLEVGPALDGRTVGWLPDMRTIAWRQNLVVAFTNPGASGRERAMFFREGDTPHALWMDPAGRAARSAQMRTDGLAGRQGPVIALEPPAHVNIRDQFYLLPILAHRTLDNERGERALRLEVVSAPATSPPPAAPDDAAFQAFRGALVFVIDTTISMAPYIDRTRQVVRDVVARIRGTEVGDRFRFGMVAYRDHMSGNAALEYVTQVVARPDLNEPPDTVLSRIDTVQEARTSNDAYDEDAMAGLKAALDEINWQPFGGRFIVLITDAGTRDANDPRSATGLDVAGIAGLAQHPTNRVLLSAIHLRTPEGRNNHLRAERQYRALTRLPGDGGSLYFPIAAGNVEQFGQVVDALTQGVLDNVSRIIGRPVGQPPTTETAEQRRVREAMASAGQAVRLSYLGEAQRQTVPDVVRSYVLDQDLDNPAPERKPLEPRVLLTSGQLSDIAATMRTIVESVNAERLTPNQFFDRLRGAMGATIGDPRRVPASQSAEFAGLFGDVLRDLPYRTQFMETTFEEFRDWGSARRRELTLRLERLMRLYAEYNRERRYWHQIEGNPNPAEAVYPLPLDQLP
jgi:hypothetical protein